MMSNRTTARVRAYMADHPGIKYTEAYRAVTGGGSTASPLLAFAFGSDGLPATFHAAGNLLMAGGTGAGCSAALQNLSAYALTHGWRVTVAPFEIGSEYREVQHMGARVLVVDGDSRVAVEQLGTVAPGTRKRPHLVILDMAAEIFAPHPGEGSASPIETAGLLDHLMQLLRDPNTCVAIRVQVTSALRATPGVDELLANRALMGLAHTSVELSVLGKSGHAVHGAPRPTIRGQGQMVDGYGGEIIRVIVPWRLGALCGSGLKDDDMRERQMGSCPSFGLEASLPARPTRFDFAGNIAIMGHQSRQSTTAALSLLAASALEQGFEVVEVGPPTLAMPSACPAGMTRLSTYFTDDVTPRVTPGSAHRPKLVIFPDFPTPSDGFMRSIAHLVSDENTCVAIGGIECTRRSPYGPESGFATQVIVSHSNWRDVPRALRAPWTVGLLKEVAAADAEMLQNRQVAWMKRPQSDQLTKVSNPLSGNGWETLLGVGVLAAPYSYSEA